MRKVFLFVSIVLFCLNASLTHAEEFLFDFESNPGSPTVGYTSVYHTTVYSTTRGYGFLSTAGLCSRNRGGTDTLMKDFVGVDGNNIFRVDIPNGQWSIHIFGGDMDYNVYQRFKVSTDGGNSWTLYGCDVTTDSPLPGTYMTNAASGLPTLRGLTIPSGHPHYQSCYLMDNHFMLEVDDTINVTVGYVLIKTQPAGGNQWPKLNCVEIVEPDEPIIPETCQEVIESKGRLLGDLNSDCIVDADDLAVIAGQWLKDRGATWPEVEQPFGQISDAFGPYVWINLDMIENDEWVDVPGVKLHWDVLGPNGETSTHNAVYSEIRDVDGDGQLDLFRLVHGGAYTFMARFDEANNMVWRSADLPGATFDENGIAVEDLDKDGYYEVITSHSGKVYCIDADTGNTKWSATTGNGLMALGHFDDTNQLGIVVRVELTVYCFDADGNQVWQHYLAGCDDSYGHELHTCDVDSDGYDEIFIGLQHDVVALTHDGNLLWQDTSQARHTDFFQFGDVDNDGRIEVVYDHDGCGGAGPLYIADAQTGNVEFAIDYRAIGIYHAQSLMVADFQPGLTGLEIVCVDKDNIKLAMWDGTGQLLWTRSTTGSLITRADWDGNGVMDIVVWTVGIDIVPAISVWDGYGNRLYAISWLPMSTRSNNTVCAHEEAQYAQPDLDGNGKADVLVAFGPWTIGDPQHLVLLEASPASP
ncbi:MAG: PQQ-binding-like beta-propeller repeat protein [Planctomycetota bacterium]